MSPEATGTTGSAPSRFEMKVGVLGSGEGAATRASRRMGISRSSLSASA
jgi:hypothetical protein